MRYALWGLLIFLIIIRFLTTKPGYKSGQRVRITTTVFSEPVEYPSSQYLKISGLKIYLPPHQSDGVGVYRDIVYGDRVVIEGIVNGDKLENPKLIEIKTGRNFTSGLHNKIVSFYQSVMPEPDGGLLAGIVIGAKGSLSQTFWEKVKKAGVAHVVVASGMNVTFVASFLMGVTTIFLTRRKAIAFVILGIILYLFISGFEAPLIRAAVMGVIAFVAQETGRIAYTWRIFLLTAFLMLLVRPDWITDIGFILSFVATASLLLFERKIRAKLSFVPEFMKEGLSTSLAAQIGVAPILFVTFGQFNILSPVINALVLWTIPPLMIIGSLGGILGLFAPGLGKLVLYLGYPLTWWFIKVVETFS